MNANNCSFTENMRISLIAEIKMGELYMRIYIYFIGMYIFLCLYLFSARHTVNGNHDHRAVLPAEHYGVHCLF